MHNSRIKTLGLLLIVLLVFVSGFSTAWAEDTASSDESEPVYVPAYFEGSTLDLTQYEGKAILMNFFTEWCPYCMEEMPDIKEVYDTYDPESLVIILVHPWDGEDETNSASVVAKYGLEDLILVEDEDFMLTSIVGLQGYPTSIFIDQNGYFYGYANAMDFESFSEIFDSMGVPKRADVNATDVAEPTPTPAAQDQ